MPQQIKMKTDLQHDQKIDPGQVAEESLCQYRGDECPVALTEKTEADQVGIQIEYDQKQNHEERRGDLSAQADAFRIWLAGKLLRIPVFPFFFEIRIGQHSF